MNKVETIEDLLNQYLIDPNLTNETEEYNKSITLKIFNIIRNNNKIIEKFLSDVENEEEMTFGNIQNIVISLDQILRYFVTIYNNSVEIYDKQKENENEKENKI